MSEQTNPSKHTLPSQTEEAWWFIFADHKMMVLEEAIGVSVPSISDPSALGLSLIRERYLGALAGRKCYGAVVSGSDPILSKTGFYHLYQLYGRFDDSLFVMAMKAFHLLEWEETARYCGRCGREMAPSTKEMQARECPGCGFLVFPRISPAVIVLVERDGQLLLARATRFTSDIYSTLAGFVEPGESLEEAIHREIQEEVGIKVRDIRYFGSQPWPFPDSLMIGFTAKYDGGEIQIDRTEIVNAGWFSLDDLPNLPGEISIARQMIDWFVKTRTQE